MTAVEETKAAGSRPRIIHHSRLRHFKTSPETGVNLALRGHWEPEPNQPMTSAPKSVLLFHGCRWRTLLSSVGHELHDFGRVWPDRHGAGVAL